MGANCTKVDHNGSNASVEVSTDRGHGEGSKTAQGSAPPPSRRERGEPSMRHQRTAPIAFDNKEEEKFSIIVHSERKKTSKEASENTLYPDTRRPGPPNGSNKTALIEKAMLALKLDQRRKNEAEQRASGDLTVSGSRKDATDATWRIKFKSYVGHGAHPGICGNNNGTRHPNSPLSSEAFELKLNGAMHKWFLYLEPFDFTRDSISIYLHCCSIGQEHANMEAIETSFALSIGKPSSPKLNMILSHTFTGDEPTWGIQECIQIDDGATYLDRNGTLEVRLKMLSASVVPGAECAKCDQSAISKHYKTTYIPQILSEEPRIIVIDNFLSGEECDHIIALASADLRRSRVASGLEIEGRTSHGTFLTGRKEKDRVVMHVEQKIADFILLPSIRTHYNRPLVRAEAMQVVRYTEGQFYHEHYDNKAGQTSMRAATFMMYLCDSQGGGATFFPRAIPLAKTAQKTSLLWGMNRAPGIRITPKRGRAVLFWSKMKSGTEDLASIHAAEVVTKGEKWIATRWLTEN